MKDETLPPAYDPKTTDNAWYEFWEEGGFFKASAHSTKAPYTIVMPPPNVTGVLHMGHALVMTLQDVLIRWKRMSGFEALWVPGTDHAGIATQMAVERYLWATEKKRRVEYTREEFLAHVWAWKENHESRILSQLKKLGCSSDWSRLRFTMDEGCNKAVRTFFKKLFDEGLIYQGDYLVNWDPVMQTALADDEVEYEEKEGSLWYFKFPLSGENNSITIATTRPETMLGDVAVAVSPKDTRYSSFVGKNIQHPLTGRIIPIIADPFVDPEFGTGAVKITPAHDPADYRMALNHNLPLINILTPDGRINEEGGPFTGLSKEEAREKIIQKMKDKGLLEKITPHTLRVGVSYRSKAVIEPYLSKQWFVRMGPFVEGLKSDVKDGRVKIIPKQWEQTYFHWINNLRDWCISRQLWWGHRIPVWHHKKTGRLICFDGEGVPPEIAHEIDEWVEDPDVLDTWFSAALWPFSTLGWPEDTADLKKFYPTNVLITGHDIIFFWVARMMLGGSYAMKEVPFHETFLHSLIYGKSYFRKNPEGGITYVMGEEKKEYDLGKKVPPEIHSKWEKLSKTKGNVIDPLELIETYGTDAMRMALCASANQVPQIDLDRRRFEEFKHFANKVWNGARFVFMNLEGLSSDALSSGLDMDLFALEDRWILSIAARRIEEVQEALSNYSFERASMTAYEFFWKELCAYYLEIAKPTLFNKKGTAKERENKQKLLVILLLKAIRLLHPMAPFITEELFQRLKKKFHSISKKNSDFHTEEIIESLFSESCMTAPYPKTYKRDQKAEADFELFERMVHAVRNIRGEMKIPPQAATDIYLIGNTEILKRGAHILSSLVKVNHLHMAEKEPTLSGLTAKEAVSDYQVVVPLPEEMAIKERARMEKEYGQLKVRLEQLKRTFDNPDFKAKASIDVIEKQRQSLQEIEKAITLLEEKLNQN